jgi:DNA-binding GntR family transcriptional regulator
MEEHPAARLGRRAAAGRTGAPSAMSGGQNVVANLTSTLTAEILDGRLPAGAPLRQDLLARRFGVSRTPIREALHRIVASGLATFQPNAGFRVRSFYAEDYVDALVIRSRLEGVAAERAAVRITCGDLKALGDANALMGDLAQKIGGDGSESLQREWTRANTSFHNLLLEAADCATLTEMISRVVTAFPREALDIVAANRNPEILREYCADHNAIYAAVEAGNGTAARTAARVHVERAVRHMRDVFQLLSANESQPELMMAGGA